MSKAETIQVFCNKAIKFKHPKDDSVVAFVRDHEFAPAPAWITETDMFEALVKDGDIKVISSAADIAKTEQAGKVIDKINELEAAKAPKAAKAAKVSDDNEGKDGNDEGKVAANVGDDEDDDDEGTNDEEATYAEMTNKALYALCTEKGIEVEVKQPKQYYLDKLEAFEAAEAAAETIAKTE